LPSHFHRGPFAFVEHSSVSRPRWTVLEISSPPPPPPTHFHFPTSSLFISSVTSGKYLFFFSLVPGSELPQVSCVDLIEKIVRYYLVWLVRLEIPLHHACCSQLGIECSVEFVFV
jgi:hypothetical protein